VVTKLLSTCIKLMQSFEQDTKVNDMSVTVYKRWKGEDSLWQ